MTEIHLLTVSPLQFRRAYSFLAAPVWCLSDPEATAWRHNTSNLPSFTPIFHPKTLLLHPSIPDSHPKSDLFNPRILMSELLNWAPQTYPLLCHQFTFETVKHMNVSRLLPHSRVLWGCLPALSCLPIWLTSFQFLTLLPKPAGTTKCFSGL